MEWDTKQHIIMKEEENFNKELNDDQRMLVCENLDLANQMAWKFSYLLRRSRHEKSILKEDLEQEALYGLMEAAIRYDENEGVEFGVFARIYCKKHILIAIHKYGTPLSTSCNYTGGARVWHLDATLEDVASGYAMDCDNGSPTDRILYQVATADNAETDAENERKALVGQMLDGLTQKECMALECLYGLDGQEMNCDETATVMGVSPSRVSKLKERGLRKLSMIFAA